ncbi:MAG TPA: Crp/Fnr family transcriptional regulator [Caulobacteraceae bacterium]|nr:Crp/Fnr family transcriptional regulator [Caulobacteraceae bacterium]
MSEAERLGLFGAMDPPLRREAIDRSRLIRARKGASILSKGDTSSDVFFVLEGRLQVLIYSANGREVSLRDLSEGDMFGEMAAIDGEGRSASIIAIDDSRLLAMSRPDFRAVIDSSPDASMWLLGQLTARIRAMTERVFELSALNVQSRLHCELLRMAARSSTGLEVRPAPTHAELANRIGTHREAVTREMRALSAQNIIKTGRRRIQFVDLARLQTSVGRLSLQAAQAEKTAAG